MDDREMAQQRPDVTAAERGGDPLARMDGEPEPGVAALDEAGFWLETYTEIVAMQEQVMARVHELMETQSEAVRREAELSNVPVLAAQLDRFRQRRGFWESRIGQLTWAPDE